MIEYYATEQNRLKKLTQPTENGWVHLIAPDTGERQLLIDQFHIEPDFFNAALDVEETSHIDMEEDQTAIIMDIPDRSQDENGELLFSTIPLTIFIKDNMLFTVCIKDTPIIRDFTNNLIRNVNTQYRTRLLFQIFYRISQTYLSYLKQIDKMTNFAEQKLQRSMRNKELFQMLQIEKSLVYFSTSLKANETTLQKIFRGRIFKIHEEDKDLLEDVLIEVTQAIEMCNIYRDILGSTMDAYASIISNNLNIVMKVLASITIIMNIPTIIGSFYGMNVPLPFPDFWFATGLSLILVIACIVILRIKRML